MDEGLALRCCAFYIVIYITFLCSVTNKSKGKSKNKKNIKEEEEEKV